MKLVTMLPLAGQVCYCPTHSTDLQLNATSYSCGFSTGPCSNYYFFAVEVVVTPAPIPECSALPPIENGSIVYEPPECAGSVGCVATYFCNPGYMLATVDEMQTTNNATSLECLAFSADGNATMFSNDTSNGTNATIFWSGLPLTCVYGMFVKLIQTLN